VPGIFAAGDVTGNFNQVVVAAGEGANAMSTAFKYVDRKFVTCK
jgi:alkyl hydroperoxide reductase subunit AhpF